MKNVKLSDYRCGICGTTGEECGSWNRCSLFRGYVCTSCCWHCYHRAKFDNCSITWCKKGAKK